MAWAGRARNTVGAVQAQMGRTPVIATNLEDCACVRLSFITLYYTLGGCWAVVQRSKLSSHLHCFPI
jgi:hypothetical protein